MIFLLNLKNYHKTKSHGTIRSDDLLACRLLKSTKLTIRDEQLVKATIGELKYDIVKTKLIKSFSDTSDVPTSELTNLNIKPESTFHAQNHPVDQSPIYSLDNGEDFDYQNQEFPAESPCGTDYYNGTFFHRNRETKWNKQKKPTKYHTKLLDTYNGQTHNHSQIIQIGELPSKNLHEDHKPIRQ